MRYRELGKTGYRVSEIGYGAWGIGGAMWLGGDDRQALQALQLRNDPQPYWRFMAERLEASLDHHLAMLEGVTPPCAG